MAIICKNGKIQGDQKWSYSRLMQYRPKVKYDGHGVGLFTGPELERVRERLESSRASRTRYTKLLYWLDKHNEAIHAMTPEERYVLYRVIGAASSVDVIRRQLYYLRKYAQEVKNV